MADQLALLVPTQTGERPAAPYPWSPASRDTDTSRQSAASIEERADTLKTAVLRVLRSWPDGLTADEIADQLHEEITSIRPRVCELAKLGRIADSGMRRPNASTRKAIVWRVQL